MPADRALTRAAIATHTRAIRLALIDSLTPALRTLVTTPGLTVDDATRAALRKTLLAYEALVEAGSTSSSPGYALRDLPAEERDSHAGALHLLNVLDQLHGPKPGAPA